MKKAILTGLAAIAAAGLGCARDAPVGYGEIESRVFVEGREFYAVKLYDDNYLTLGIARPDRRWQNAIEWTRYEPANSSECSGQKIKIVFASGEILSMYDNDCDFRIEDENAPQQANDDATAMFMQYYWTIDGVFDVQARLEEWHQAKEAQ